jgi:hypothetical protein
VACDLLQHLKSLRKLASTLWQDGDEMLDDWWERWERCGEIDIPDIMILRIQSHGQL